MPLSSLVTTGLAGVVFGLALAAPPGPMNAIIAEESVVRGWLSGFTAGLGAMTADAVFFVLALLGAVTFVEQFPSVQGAMVGVGGLLMLYFAYGAARDVQATFTGAIDPETDDASRGFRKAFVLALTNPYQIVFWLTVGIKLLEAGRVDVLSYTPYVGDALAGVLIVQTGTPVLLAGLFGGIVVWIVSFPAGLVAAGERIDRFTPAIAAISALVLAGFGVLFLIDAGAKLGVGQAFASVV
jgi:threonine/homoserine/homoserine lactone efflux protein